MASISSFPFIYAYRTKDVGDGYDSKCLTIYGISMTPIILIELIHFLPAIFERYYYENLSIHLLINILLLFNLLKFLSFFIHNGEQFVIVDYFMGHFLFFLFDKKKTEKKILRNFLEISQK